MMTTWASGEALAQAAIAAHKEAPDDPRTLNLLGLATLRWRGSEGGQDAFNLLRNASEASKDYLPSVINMAAIAAAADDQQLQSVIRAERERRMTKTLDWASIDGPTLPFGFGDCAVERSLALQQAIRTGSPEAFAKTLTD